MTTHSSSKSSLARVLALASLLALASPLSASTAAPRVVNGDPNPHYIMFRFYNDTGVNESASILVTHKLAESVVYSNLESYSVSALRVGLTAFLRPVVKSGGNYFIGSVETLIGTSYPASPTTLDFESVNWLEYNPLTSIADTSGSSATLNDTDQIGWVGFYFLQNLANGTSQRDLNIKALQVTAIPEPSSLGLLAAVAVGASLHPAHDERLG
jgi:hypothetical protein